DPVRSDAAQPRAAALRSGPGPPPPRRGRCPPTRERRGDAPPATRIYRPTSGRKDRAGPRSLGAVLAERGAEGVRDLSDRRERADGGADRREQVVLRFRRALDGAEGLGGGLAVAALPERGEAALLGGL